LRVNEFKIAPVQKSGIRQISDFRGIPDHGPFLMREGSRISQRLRHLMLLSLALLFGGAETETETHKETETETETETDKETETDGVTETDTETETHTETETETD